MSGYDYTNALDIVRALRDVFHTKADAYDFQDSLTKAFCTLFDDVLTRTFTEVLLDITKKATETPKEEENKEEE